jgi:hypothetical protein
LDFTLSEDPGVYVKRTLPDDRTDARVGVLALADRTRFDFTGLTLLLDAGLEATGLCVRGADGFSHGTTEPHPPQASRQAINPAAIAAMQKVARVIISHSRVFLRFSSREMKKQEACHACGEAWRKEQKKGRGRMRPRRPISPWLHFSAKEIPARPLDW